MKRLFSILIMIICFTLVACEDPSEHIGEGKTPSGSIIMQGRNYLDVVETFENRGFTNIKTEEIRDIPIDSAIEEGSVERVTIEGDDDYEVDKWLSSDVEVIIYFHTIEDDMENIPIGDDSANKHVPLTVDNCPEFETFVRTGITTEEDEAAWFSFLESHNGYTIEFDGTITDWYDEMFWVSVSFGIAIEDSEHLTYSESSIDLIKLGMSGDYHYSNYHLGLISEGMRVHVITEVKQKGDVWKLSLKSMEIIE